MCRWIRRLSLLMVALIGAVAVVFVVGMRSKSPGVQRAVRRMNKDFWNPRAMATAGTPGAYASVVHHAGRRSGIVYTTPVVPAATEDGFIVALPYGTRADWVQNVLAAGRATITHEGESYDVDSPEVLPIGEFDVYFGESDQRAHRMFDVGECLRVRVQGQGPASESQADRSGPAADG